MSGSSIEKTTTTKIVGSYQGKPKSYRTGCKKQPYNEDKVVIESLDNGQFSIFVKAYGGVDADSLLMIRDCIDLALKTI